jgi:hypothetical protein
MVFHLEGWGRSLYMCRIAISDVKEWPVVIYGLSLICCFSFLCKGKNVFSITNFIFLTEQVFVLVIFTIYATKPFAVQEA